MALKTRQEAGIDLRGPICVYDLCERLNVSVRFADIPSMEGVYLPDTDPKPAIIVSSLRPPGRQALTCGHELGHHLFGHGEQFDELFDGRTDQRKNALEEFEVDIFSTMLHMPKLAVNTAFTCRSLNLLVCAPTQIFELAGWFGVGYSTLVMHMARTLMLIPAAREASLLKYQPKDIRAEIFGEDCPTNLYVADQHWTGRAIDLQVGDILIAPRSAEIEGEIVEIVDQSETRTVLRACAPGISRISHNDASWAAFVRVMRRGYVGLAPYRFDEEAGDDA
ncbi:MAG: ImmA/IrrE family metallo-endopeptidase [Candidatus Binatia bacterium]